jgi:diguanylate cyclase (GGDEF)-like protein
VRDRLAAVFARREDPYAGVDLANASRFGGALWFVGASMTAVLLPFVHPTQSSIGDAGWVVTAVILVGAVVAGWRMRMAGANVNVDELLFWSFSALACVALLVWLSGGLGSPYAQMYVLSILYTCAVHPPRRTLAYLSALTVLVLLPLVYDDVGRRQAVELVTELFVWLALGMAVGVLMTYVRAQRLGLRREGEQARRQARLDPLTGLLNRRAFDEDLARAVDRARANAEPLSALVGDLDDFKDFNDRFGHLEGDRVLRAVASALRTALRRPDIAYRWGGDEFAVILPQADANGGRLVAERIEAAVARTSGPDGQALGLSTGVAELDDDGPEALLAAADRTLMRAKGLRAVEIRQTRG